MPHVTDTPPEAVREDFQLLDGALDESLPPRILDRSLLIGTWNLRHFGGLTEKWASEPGDSPKRDLQSILTIAEVIRRFDVIALQEVRGDLKALRHTLKALGPDWGLVLSDVTRGGPGNDERLGFLFDRRTVRMSGLAGEIVLPVEELEGVSEGALGRQFARTPYAVAFRCGGETFILVTLHVLWGASAEERTPELHAIAEWLDGWARDVNAWDHNLIALGDFNIDRAGDERYRALTSTGLEVPDDLHAVPRTLWSDPDEPHLEKFYDQIAWFTADGDRPALSLDYREGGFFDFEGVALPRRSLDRRSLSWRISDHYPLWAAFDLG